MNYIIYLDSFQLRLKFIIISYLLSFITNNQICSVTRCEQNINPHVSQSQSTKDMDGWEKERSLEFMSFSHTIQKRNYYIFMLINFHLIISQQIYNIICSYPYSWSLLKFTIHQRVLC